MSVPASPPTAARWEGLNPWLPWPLSAWPWWTNPVPAQRLAILRIGLAAVLLVDLLINYLPHLEDYFTAAGIGDPKHHASYGEAPKLWWSLLRGFAHPLLSFVAMAAFAVLGGYLMLDAWARLVARPKVFDGQRRTWPIVVWQTAGVFVVLSIWARDVEFASAPTPMSWLAPFAVFFVTWMVWLLESLRRLGADQRDNPRQWLALTIAWVLGGLLFLLGLFHWLYPDWQFVWHAEWWRVTLLSWQLGDPPFLLHVSIYVWLTSVALLLIGWQTRAAAIVAWILSTSFANVNPNIDNAGDTVRGIILFYLMLCPCGAAFSVDAWRKRRRGLTGPVFVSPWPLRLLFIQMMFIYFCNGMYKVGNRDWLDGDSMYLVLSDLTLTRFSHAQLPVPDWMTRLMTWSVLAWEITFPILVLHRWTRFAALLMGVFFHLGIFLSLELGGFGPYMLTLYLPFLPWERWFGPKPQTA